MKEGNSRVNEPHKGLKKAVSLEGVITLVVTLGFFGFLINKMGVMNMFNTFINTAHDLLLNTVFFIMGIAVLAGAVGSMLTEFGVISMLNKALSLLMKPLYKMPGASVLGILTTYLSDNPAIITLAKDKGFRRFFKKHELPALTNMGTAFGMGLVVTTFMISQTSPTGESFFLAALVGNLGALAGSVVSVRIMLSYTKKHYANVKDTVIADESSYDVLKYRQIREGSAMQRLLASLLEGGKSGVEIGMSIIPGVLIICTIVLMFTNGPSAKGYTGAAYEGVALLPAIAKKLEFILTPLFGFSSPEAIAVPITSLGAVGAALGLVPKLLSANLISGNDIAVFTAIGMCWSGYLSTHVAMMDSLECRELTGKAIFSHTIGGLVAGIVAHWLYVGIGLIL